MGVDGCTYGRRKAGTDGWMDGRMEGLTDGWMDGVILFRGSKILISQSFATVATRVTTFELGGALLLSNPMVDFDKLGMYDE